MNTTTTTTEGSTSPVVVLTAHLHMTSAVERLQAHGNAMRDALEPLRHITETVGREAARVALESTTLQDTTEAIMRHVSEPARKAGEAIAAHRRRIAAAGRSHHLAALDADARRIAHGHAGIAVRIVRLIADLHAEGRDYEADLVAAALRGDEASLRDIASLVAEGAPLGLQVLAIADDLDALADAVVVFTTEVAALTNEITTANLHDLTRPITPPRTFLAGSVDTTAPPAALQRGSGKVHAVFSHLEAA